MSTRTQPFPTPDEMQAIELRARRMRAEVIAGGIRAARRALARLAGRLGGGSHGPARA